MAGRNWLGTGVDPDDLGATDNWSGATLPISDGEIFFPSTAPVGPGGPDTDMDDLTLVDSDLIEVTQGVTYSIGGSGTPMLTSADKVSVRSTSGKFWYRANATVTDWVVIDSTSSSPLSHDCFSAGGGTGTISYMDVMRGMATIEAGGTVTVVTVDGNEAKLVIDSGATSVPTGILCAGVVLASLVVPTVHISGGAWTQLAGVPTTIEQTGGHSIWKKSGTITAVYAFRNSVLDFTQADGVTTITTLYKHPAARVLGWNPENNGMVVATNLRVLSGDMY